jgi:hypothetical protein
MKSFAEKIRWCIFAVGLAGILIGPLFAFFFSKYPDEDRWYPLWANSLFAAFPSKARGFTLTFYRLDNDAFPSGRNFYEVFPTFEGGGLSPSTLIDLMGTAQRSQNMDRLKIARQKFEEHFFKEFNQVVYSIDWVEWTPVARYKSGVFEKKEELVVFQYQKRN